MTHLFLVAAVCLHIGPFGVCDRYGPDPYYTYPYQGEPYAYPYPRYYPGWRRGFQHYQHEHHEHWRDRD